MINNKIKNQRGFTLVETLFAVLVLTIALAAPLTIASKGLQAALIGKDQVTATFLAQDAIEYVRFVRDSDRLGNSSWLTNLGACVPGAGIIGCYLDSTAQNPSVPTSCSTTCPVMDYSPTTGLYEYTSVGATPSIFTRVVSITTPVGSNSNEASVTVTVSWTEVGGAAHSVVAQEDIFNWQ